MKRYYLEFNMCYERIKEFKDFVTQLEKGPCDIVI